MRSKLLAVSSCSVSLVTPPPNRCTHRAMDPLTRSSCPLCRTQLEHFALPCAPLYQYVASRFFDELMHRVEEVGCTPCSANTPAAPSQPRHPSSAADCPSAYHPWQTRALEQDEFQAGSTQVEIWRDRPADLSCRVCGDRVRRGLVSVCGHLFCADCFPANPRDTACPCGA